MRKIICLALVTLMVLAAVPALASPTYQLWGISFGSDKATFLAKVQAEQGIEFVGDSMTIYSRDDQGIKVYGYPAKISASFVNGLYSVVIEFAEISGTLKENVVAEAVNRIRTICESMTAQNGSITGGHFKVGPKDTEYNFPMAAGLPDYDVLTHAALAEQMTTIQIDYSNVQISANIVDGGSTKNGIKAFVNMWFWDHPIESGFSFDLASYGQQQIG